MRRKPRPIPHLHDLGAVVFDLDGVLVDSESMHFRAANCVLERYGRAISEAEYIRYIGLGEAATWAAWREVFGLSESVDALCAINTDVRVHDIAAGIAAIED